MRAAQRLYRGGRVVTAAGTPRRLSAAVLALVMVLALAPAASAQPVAGADHWRVVQLARTMESVQELVGPLSQMLRWTTACHPGDWESVVEPDYKAAVESAGAVLESMTLGPARVVIDGGMGCVSDYEVRVAGYAPEIVRVVGCKQRDRLGIGWAAAPNGSSVSLTYDDCRLTLPD